MGHKMLAKLQLSLLLNRLQHQANNLRLSLTGPAVVLEPLIDQWRDRWPELTYVYHHDDDASWLNQRPSHQENRDVIIQFHSR